MIKAPWLFNAKSPYPHSTPALPGTKNTLTTATTAMDLGAVPPIVDNPPRWRFDRMPGVVLAEQQTPSTVNLS